jgi:hypothetical protein
MARFRLAACCTVLFLLFCVRPALGDLSSPVVVEVDPGAADLDATALRAAASRDLGVRVLAPGDPGAADAVVRVAVGIDRERGELVVTRGAVARRIALPRDPVEAQKAAVFLIGNLARDQASDVIAGLGPPAGPPFAAPAPPEPPPPPPLPLPRRRWWIGVALEGDALVVPSARDVCARPGLYTCTFPPPGPSLPSVVSGRSDQVQGGLALGAPRLTAAIDYALDDNLLVGARLGLALHDDGFHAEARGTYVLGDRPLGRAGVAPSFTWGLGFAQYSATVPVTLYWQAPQGVTQASADARRSERPFFVAAGAGLRVAPSAGFALVIHPLRAVVVAGAYSPLVVLAPDLSVQLGF